MTSLINWHIIAIKNIGVTSLLRLKFMKYFSSASSLNKLTSKLLLNPVYARSGTGDIFVYNQIFIEREYECLDHIENPGLIIDCGANVGYSSAYFLSKFSKCFVIAVEPDVDNFALLQKNLAPYVGRYIVLQAAVWPTIAKLGFNEEFSGKGQEWSRRVVECVDGDMKSDDVQAVTVPALLQSSSFDRISILKVDIEGTEIEVFDSTANEWLPKVDNIVIELHGSRATQRFYEAIRNQSFRISRSGELTVCVR